MLCWRCGAEVPPDAETCPECDTPLGGTPTRGVRGAGLSCPVCGCAWEEEQEFCPECGASAADAAQGPEEGEW